MQAVQKALPMAVHMAVLLVVQAAIPRVYDITEYLADRRVRQ
jgi:hypothetical protein